MHHQDIICYVPSLAPPWRIVHTPQSSLLGEPGRSLALASEALLVIRMSLYGSPKLKEFCHGEAYPICLCCAGHPCFGWCSEKIEQGETKQPPRPFTTNRRNRRLMDEPLIYEAVRPCKQGSPQNLSGSMQEQSGDQGERRGTGQER